MKLLKHIMALALCSFVYSANAADTIIVGTEPTFAPFGFIDSKTNEIVGFDIDLINAIGKEEKLNIKIEPMPFDGLIPSLMSSSIDAVISGLTITEERQKQVLFSEGYYVAAQDLMIRKEDLGKYKAMNDLKGKAVCAQIGSAGADVAAGIPDARVVTFNTMVEAFMELKRKGCDASITGTPVNQYYLISTGEKELVHVPESAVNAKQLGIAVNKKNTALADKINDGLKKLHEKGVYDELYRKWFNQ
ncbi:polar amino acid transport system substrate-binding protein [Succinivibrio dextrinosolvens DSM 3072]|uniref:Polar amino acid transport system substrate-binding protein n=1 Tax=Succinivibrio dextrinosolvens DSM 3072 TaxID=1123324 RepID=A0A1T4VWE7_9GAMM|nr:basic amino acid ABC transporter substrate-binding protein [Succinivibrio dextrinosolvens]SKA69340.1 polar amino acid transport system substrate-binding protein [Succinivibrio dextrinosolvens DSM 3072]